jgi:hypothetical protein
VIISDMAFNDSSDNNISPNSVFEYQRHCDWHHNIFSCLC